jgi:hypothetical protein
MATDKMSEISWLFCCCSGGRDRQSKIKNIKQASHAANLVKMSQVKIEAKCNEEKNE